MDVEVAEENDDVEEGDFRRKTGPKTRTHTLCDVVQSTCITTAIVSEQECPMPIPRHPFCWSLRSGNAHSHFTRAILHTGVWL